MPVHRNAKVDLRIISKMGGVSVCKIELRLFYLNLVVV